MKRLHVHVAVTDLSQSIRFYSTLFAREPSVVRETFLTTGESTTYGTEEPEMASGACCETQAAPAPSRCCR